MVDIGLDGTPYLLRGLDAQAVLDRAAESVPQRRQAELRQLRFCEQWALLHPASPGDGARWSEVLGHDRVDSAGPVEADPRIGGQGCPELRAGCLAELGAALGLTRAAVAYLMEDSLDLVFRLPRIWARCQELEIDMWKSRRVARLTHRLSAEAAGFVDAELADRLGRVGARTIDQTVALAIARFHPERLDESARKGKAGWHVDVHHPEIVDFASTSTLDASADSLDLEDFAAGLAKVADELAEAGDTDPRPQRLAKALGVIGRRLAGREEHPWPAEGEPASTEAESEPTSDRTGSAGGSRRPARRARSALVVRVHLSESVDDRGAPTAVYEVPRFGAVGEEVFQRWLVTHGGRVHKVVDLARTGAADTHEPPGWMRIQVQTRDGHCVFPACSVPAEGCDLDHVVPYDPHGPPGQTNPENLACLCRHHHLLKTHAGWAYKRAQDGTYVWTSPLGRIYLTTQNGTTHFAGLAA